MEVSKCYSFHTYQVDSIIAFNSDSTRLYSTLNKRLGEFYNSVADNVNELAGAKINSKWYFFMGASLHLPRSFYQDSTYAPLSFSELSYIGRKEFLHSAVIENPNGTYSPNERFFNQYFFDTAGTWSGCITPIDFDNRIIKWISQYHQKKLDPMEVAQIKKSIAESKKPLEPPIDYLYNPIYCTDYNPEDEDHYSRRDGKCYSQKIYYPKDTIGWYAKYGKSFYSKRGWLERQRHPFQPKVFGRQNEDDPWK